MAFAVVVKGKLPGHCSSGHFKNTAHVVFMVIYTSLVAYVIFITSSLFLMNIFVYFSLVRLPVQKLTPSLVLLFAFQISTKKSHCCGPFQKPVKSLQELQM